MTIRLLNNLTKVPLSALLILILIGSVIANSNIFSVYSQTVPTASPSLALSSIFDLPNMKIILSNTTGYEAEAPLKNSNGLVWHISVNTKPHAPYTPTQQDIQRIQRTGQPLYNVKIQNAVTTNTISSKISFLVPYSALTGSSSTPSSPGTHLPQSQLSSGGNSGVTNPNPSTTTPSTSSSPPIPTANDQSIATNVNNPISITLGGSSSNPNADLTATIVNNPVHGTLSQIDQQTGLVTYTPNQDYVGTDSFTFKVNDGNQDSSNTGTVSITVTNWTGNGNSNTGATDGNGNNQQTQQQQNAHFQPQLQKLSLSSETTSYPAVTTTTSSSSLLSTSSLPAAAVIPVAEGSSLPTQQPQQQDNGQGEGGPLQTFNNAREKPEVVEGTIYEILEAKEAVSKGVAEIQENVIEQLSNLADAITSYKEIHDTFQELKELEECRDSSPLKQAPSPEGAITGDEQINQAKADIISNFLFQAFDSGLAKLLGGSLVGGKAVETSVTKYGEGVFKDNLDYRMALIKALSKCMQSWKGTVEFYYQYPGDWESNTFGGGNWKNTEMHKGDFVFNINKDFTITNTGPQIGKTLGTDYQLKIVGSGKASVSIDASCGISASSTETFLVQGTFNLKTSVASIQFSKISPDTFSSAGGSYPKCPMGLFPCIGSSDPCQSAPLQWSNAFPEGLSPSGPELPNNFDLDLSKGHIDFSKTYAPYTYAGEVSGAYIRITAEKQLKPFSGNGGEPPNLKPFSGKIAQSTLSSSLSPLSANSEAITTNTNTPAGIILSGTDHNQNADLTASIITQPAHGTLSQIDQATGKVTYSPQSGYTGQDSFTFKVNDGKSDSNNTGTVSISIGGKDSTGWPAPSVTATTPTAADQSITTSTNTPVDITLSGTDPNPNADLTASIITQPAHGTLSQIDQATGKVTYSPQSGYTGQDSFTFKVNDGNSSSNEATVNFTIK